MKMDKPNWREFSDTERLDWLMEFTKNGLLSRSSIDEAIARDEFFAHRTPLIVRQYGAGADTTIERAVK